MPEISRFYGIRITMYYAPKEHPPAHFHAEVGDDDAMIDIATGNTLEGWIPNKSLSKVREWCELQQNWTRSMSRHESLQPIAPLP